MNSKEHCNKPPREVNAKPPKTNKTKPEKEKNKARTKGRKVKKSLGGGGGKKRQESMEGRRRKTPPNRSVRKRVLKTAVRGRNIRWAFHWKPVPRLCGKSGAKGRGRGNTC